MRAVCFCVSFVMLLGACSVKELSGLSPEVQGASLHPIFYATQRSSDQLGTIFGDERNSELHFGEITVSIPPNHEVGQIEWNSRTPNPATEFAVTSVSETQNLSAFARKVRSSQKAYPGETVVFIHGYNTTAAQAVFRLAQMQADLDLRDPSVLYTWPSAGRLRGYVYDRDSVLFARDELVNFLDELSKNNHRIILAAHSLGTHLAMEALRQARLTGRDRMLDQISAVVLMAPDIDLDVFSSQVKAIGDLPQPFFVLSARQDRALNFSSLLTGRARLGKTVDQKTFQQPDVIFLDFSEFATGERFDHLVPVTSPAAVEFMQSLIDSGTKDDPTFRDFLVSAEGGNSALSPVEIAQGLFERQ